MTQVMAKSCDDQALVQVVSLCKAQTTTAALVEGFSTENIGQMRDTW